MEIRLLCALTDDSGDPWKLTADPVREKKTLPEYDEAEDNGNDQGKQVAT